MRITVTPAEPPISGSIRADIADSRKELIWLLPRFSIRAFKILKVLEEACTGTEMGYLSKKIGALEQSVRVVVISNSVQKFLRKVVL